VFQRTGSGGAPPRQLSARANAAGRRDGVEREADEPLQRLRLPNRLALLAGDTPSAPHRGTQRPPGLLGAGGAKAVSAKWGAVETPGARRVPSGGSDASTSSFASRLSQGSGRSWLGPR